MRRIFPLHCTPLRRQAAALAHSARALATAKKLKKGEEKPVIGVVGIGKMGAAMAANLLEANVGAEIVVHDPFNAPAVEALVRKGACSASLEEVGRRCSVVLTMLPNDKELVRWVRVRAANADGRGGGLALDLGRGCSCRPLIVA